jgi:hypothetical protein
MARLFDDPRVREDLAKRDVRDPDGEDGEDGHGA